jgi:MSHA biogenesis protein MshI
MKLWDADLRDILRRWRQRPPVVLELRRDGYCFVRVQNGEAELITSQDVDPLSTRYRELLLESLRHCVQSQGLGGSPAATFLFREDYNLQVVDAPKVPAGEMLAALRWQLADLLDFPVQEAVLAALPVPDTEGQQIFAVAARQSVIQERVDLLRGAGLQPFYVGIIDLALRDLCWLLPEEAGGVGLLLVETRSSHLILVQGGSYRFGRPLPLGSAHFPGADDPAGFRAASEDLALEIQRTMDFYENRFRRPPPAVLYLSGAPKLLPEMLGELLGRRCAHVQEMLSPADSRCLLAQAFAAELPVP